MNMDGDKIDIACNKLCSGLLLPYWVGWCHHAPIHLVLPALEVGSATRSEDYKKRWVGV